VINDIFGICNLSDDELLFKRISLNPVDLIITHKFRHRLGPEEPSVVGAIEVSP
jgi:hypothetical protein